MIKSVSSVVELPYDWCHFTKSHLQGRPSAPSGSTILVRCEESFLPGLVVVVKV